MLRKFQFILFLVLLFVECTHIARDLMIILVVSLLVSCLTFLPEKIDIVRPDQVYRDNTWHFYCRLGRRKLNTLLDSSKFIRIILGKRINNFCRFFLTLSREKKGGSRSNVEPIVCWLKLLAVGQLQKIETFIVVTDHRNKWLAIGCVPFCS